MTSENPEGREIIVLERDEVNGWFAHVRGKRRETETNADTKTEALESLLWTLEDMEW